MVSQAEPLAGTVVERVSVGVSQLELDMFVIGFHGSRADPEFSRDPAGSKAGAAQRKDMQLAVSQVRNLGMCRRPPDDLVNGAQCDPRTNVELTSENGINGTDQLFPRAGLHPVARGAGTQGALCINLFRLSRDSENPHPLETCRELLDEKNSVVIAKKRLNQEKVGLMLFQQLTRGPLISCQPAHRKTQVPADDRSQSFARDHAIVGDNDARSSRGDRVGNRSHNLEGD
jgi:hypothetical protein